MSNDQLRRKGKLEISALMELRRLMDLCHSSAMGDHSGVTITKKRLDGILQLKGLWKDVRKFVRGSHANRISMIHQLALEHFNYCHGHMKFSPILLWILLSDFQNPKAK